jgi:hypothetical protein
MARRDELKEWREAGRARPRADASRGGGGVAGDEWDRVYVLADNARLPRGESAEVLRFQIVNTPVAGTADRVISVPRALAGVRSVKIDSFTWPTLPSPPAMKTNSAQVSVLIEQLAGRGAALGGTGAGAASHFRGELVMAEPAAYLYYQSVSIADALARSIGARVRWQRDEVVFAPPVSLEALSLVVMRGDRRLTWPPYRMAVDLSFVQNVANTTTISLAGGAEHGLEVGMLVYFEATPVTAAGGTVTELAADTAVAITAVSSTTATLAPTIASATTSTASGVNVLIPARRLQIGFEMEVARVEWD